VEVALKQTETLESQMEQGRVDKGGMQKLEGSMVQSGSFRGYAGNFDDGCR
jgi:hypothetical protein